MKSSLNINHKKIAEILDDNDSLIKSLFNKSIDESLNKPGLINTISKPFKRLYINLTKNEDNINSGLKNLSSLYLKNNKKFLSDYLSSIYANEFSKLNLNDKLNLVADIFGNGKNLNKFKNYILNKYNVKQNLFKNIDTHKLYNNLNSGYFNNINNAKNFINNISSNYKNIERHDSNPIYKNLIKLLINNKINSFESNINNKKFASFNHFNPRYDKYRKNRLMRYYEKKFEPYSLRRSFYLGNKNRIPMRRLNFTDIDNLNNDINLASIYSSIARNMKSQEVNPDAYGRHNLYDAYNDNYI